MYGGILQRVKRGPCFAFLEMRFRNPFVQHRHIDRQVEEFTLAEYGIEDCEVFFTQLDFFRPVSSLRDYTCGRTANRARW